MNIDREMLDHFDDDWKVVAGDLNHRLSPGSRMNINSTRTWIVGPHFPTTQGARKFLEQLRAALELVVEAKEV